MKSPSGVTINGEAGRGQSVLNPKFNAVICQIERTRIESGLPDGFDDLVSLRFPQQPRTNRHMSGLYFTAAGSVSEALCTRALSLGPAG